MRQETFRIEGMHCQSCVAVLEKALRREKGVRSATVNLATQTARIEYDQGLTGAGRLLLAIRRSGYEGHLAERRAGQGQELRRLRQKTILSAALAAPTLVLGMLFMSNPLPYQDYIMWLLATPVQFYIGSQFYRGAWLALKNRTANMDTLIALGTSAAYFFSAYAVLFGHMHQYFETSAVLITLVVLGKYLEALAKGRTTQAISSLVKMEAKTATVVRKGAEQSVPIDELKAGDIVLVRPGEKVPVDGVIIDGASAIDESLVTGESIPADKKKGDKVIGSTINKTGSFRFRATRVGAETTLARIIRLVEDAQTRKAPIQRFADTVSAYFVPAVVAVAAVTFAVWLMLADTEFALIASVAVLVIACPCALGLATPTAIMVGTGMGASRGILIKGGDALETAHRLKHIVFDKTGTITQGRPVVTDVVGERRTLQIAASIERSSEHPVAKAIVSRHGGGLLSCSGFRAIAGKGIMAKVGRRQYYLGSQRLMQEQNIDAQAFRERIAEFEKDGKTVMILGEQNKAVGVLAVADEIKEDSPHAIKRLREMGLNVYLITGDNERTAKAIAEKAGISDYFAEVLPEEKALHVKRLQKTGRVGAVGDGINDAPMLAQADIGIAMGKGTDVAMETGSIVLMRDSLLDIPKAIKLSRLTMKKIRQNMFWALFYNSLGIPIAAGVLYPFTGWLLSPMIAAGAMALSSVSVITNSLLLKRKLL